MKKTILMITLLLSFTLGLLGCETITIEPDVELTLTVASTVKVGAKTQAEVSFNPADKAENVTWFSSNTNVATIDDQGLITALTPGTTIITVALESNNHINAKKSITVEENPNPVDSNYLVDGDTWVFFTGVVYSFNTSDIYLKDPTSPVLELVTGDNKTQIYPMQVGETIITNHDQSQERIIKVVHQIACFGNGSDVSEFMNNSLQASYLDQTSKPMYVGYQNEFVYDLSVIAYEFNSNREVITTNPTIDQLTLEYHFIVGDEVYPNDQVIETTDQGIKFKSSLEGKQVTVSVSPKYQLDGDEFSCDYQVEINDGYNAYNNDDLKVIFGDLAVEKINILRNITAELYENQYYEYNGQKVPYNTHSAATELAGKSGSVYLRYGAESIGQLVIEGNYFTILGKDLPLMIGNESDSSQGGFVDGHNPQGSRQVVSAQSGIFRVDVGTTKTSSDPNENLFTINNLTVIANTNRPIADDLTTSGGYICIRNYSVDTVLNNTILRYGVLATQSSGKYVNMTLNKTIASDSWANNLFIQNGAFLELKECLIKNAGGAAIVVIDEIEDTAVNPTLIIDDKTVIDNITSADAQWFKAYGLSVIQTLISAIEANLKELNAQAATLGVPFNKTIFADQGSSEVSSKFNFAVLYQNSNPLTGGNPYPQCKVVIGDKVADRAYNYKTSNPFISAITSMGAVFMPFGFDLADNLLNTVPGLMALGYPQEAALLTAFAQAILLNTSPEDLQYFEILPGVFNCGAIIPVYNVK